MTRCEHVERIYKTKQTISQVMAIIQTFLKLYIHC